MTTAIERLSTWDAPERLLRPAVDVLRIFARVPATDRGDLWRLVFTVYCNHPEVMTKLEATCAEPNRAQ